MPVYFDLFDLDQTFYVIDCYRTHFKNLKKYCKSKYFKKTCNMMIEYCGYLIRKQVIDLDYVDKIKESYWVLRRCAITDCKRG